MIIDKYMIVAIGCGVFIVIVLILVVSIRRCHRSRNKKTFLQPTSYPPGDIPLLQEGLVVDQNQTFAQQFNGIIDVHRGLHAEYSDLGGSKNWIGKGFFGDVYLCTVSANRFPLLHSTLEEKRRGTSHNY